MSGLSIAFWLGWMAAFAGLEWWGLRNKADRWAPLTQLIKTWMRSPFDPRYWVFVGLFLWAGIHFFLRGWTW